jgi:hypothetical protein
MMEQQTELLIVGGGVGGCAAALAALRRGCRVTLTEESDWIGGQLTSQAVPPDEHGWIEQFGCPASYRDFRERVRAYYRRNYPIRDEYRLSPTLNPGNGWVSPLCHEPRVALAVLTEMLAPHLSSGQLTLLTGYRAVEAAVVGAHVKAIRLRDQRGGGDRWITARLVIDATELGELLPLTETEFVTGFEAQTQTGEPSAPPTAAPGNSQAFSFCFILEHRLDHPEGEEHLIERPVHYDFWRGFIPPLTPPWPGPLLSWTITNPRLMSPTTFHFNPHQEPSTAFAGLWTYRRILDRSLFTPGSFPSDLCTVNWPQTDYLRGDLCTGSDEDRQLHLAEARQQSLSLVYWLQTEAPRPDGGTGWPGLRLRGDLTGGRPADLGLAMMPYIRESRRISAELTIVEQHVSAACRPGRKLAASFHDTVGVGCYRIDLHPTCGGDNYLDVESLPFQIPLGALIPVRMENLLPAAKNIGTTHITNGCYRVHPVEWNIGEAAGTLAAFCLRHGHTPREVRNTFGLLEELQRDLVKGGVELAWPAELNLAEGDPHRHAQAQSR